MADLTQYIDELTPLRADLETASASGRTNGNDIVVQVSERLRQAEIRRDGLASIGKLTDVLQSVRAETNTSPFVQRVFVSIKSDVQVMTHSEEVANSVLGDRLKVLAAALAETQDRFSKRDNDALWATTDKTRADIAVLVAKPIRTKNGDEGVPSGVIRGKIEELARLRQAVVVQLSGLTDPSKINELKGILTKVDETLGSLQREQSRLYDVWVVKKLKSLT